MDPTLVNCAATSATPATNTNPLLDNLPYCGSCDRAQGRKNIINGTCMNTFSKCGGELKTCRSGQTCVAAKCACLDSTANLAFTWQDFIDHDPDGDNKFDITHRPASGCSSVIGNVAGGAFVRAEASLLKLKRCAELAFAANQIGQPITKMTPADLKNATYLAQLCPASNADAAQDTCPPQFCTEVIKNLTSFERSDMCGFAFDLASQIKRCAQDLRTNSASDGKGDLTCANNLARQFAASDRQTLTWMDMFSFLGCDKPREDFVYHFSIAERGTAFMYRGEVANILLGGAATTTLNALVALVLFAVLSFSLA